jgi:Zn-dependent protease
MSFRLFGVPVTIRVFFWIGAVLLGMSDPLTLWIWVPVVLVSVLVHEFGHALAILRHGVRPEIVLHGMGGTTHWDAPYEIARWERAVIALAGPFAGFVLAGLVFATKHYLLPDPLPRLAAILVFDLLAVNVGWGLVNLVPVLPFDGGHVLEQVLGPRRARTTATISLAVATLFALYFAWAHQPWGAVLFTMFAIRSYQLMQLPPGAVLVDPLMGGTPRGGRAASSAPGPLRRWWLERKLRRLKAQAEQLSGASPRRRAGGPALRVIEGGGGGDKPPKDKRYLN